MGGGAQATASTVDLTSSVASIMQAANELYPQLTTAGIALQTQLNNSANQSAGYNQVANRAITFQQQLLGIEPVNLVQKQTSAAFNSLTSQIQGAFGNLAQYSGDSGVPNTNFSSKVSGKNAGGPQGKGNAPGEAAGFMGDTQPRVNTGFSSAANSAEYYQTKLDKANSLIGTAYDKSLSVEQRQQAATEAQTLMDQLHGEATQTGIQDGKVLHPQAAMLQVGAAIQSFNDEFKSNYDPNLPKAFTPGEVSDLIQANPEYKASYDSGMQALNRTAAAGGMLSSGNAMRAAADFGTQLAGTVYKDLLQNTASLTGQASGVAAQNAQQTAQNAMGGYQAQTAPQQYRSSALMQIGQNQKDAAITNAQLQTQVSMANAQASQQNSAGMGQLAGAVGGRLLGAFGL